MITLEKIWWKLVLVLGIVVVFFGIFGNAAVLTDYRLGPEVLNVGYLVMSIGGTILGLSIYKIHKINEDWEEFPKIQGLTTDEQVIEFWRYQIKIGFLKWKDQITAITNKRILVGDVKSESIKDAWNLSDIEVVATDRKSLSEQVFAFSHRIFQDPGTNLGYGSGSGVGYGKSQVYGNLEIIERGYRVFTLTHVPDPDGVVQRINMIKSTSKTT